MEPSANDNQEMALVEALRAGDESAFLQLVERYNSVMIRLARSFVQSEATAEEVVQEAWIGVLSGIGRFEGRASLKWWILRILTNCAKTRGKSERRFVPWSALASTSDDAQPAVDPERFLDTEHPRWAGGWASPPKPWADDMLASNQMLQIVKLAIERLPPAQGQVMWLRDVEGLDAEQVCELLSLSEVNQRVLLHRARSRVRSDVESYLNAEAAS